MKGAVFPFISYHGTEAPPVGYRGRYEKASSFQGLVFLQQWEALRLAFARRIHSFWTRYKAQ